MLFGEYRHSLDAKSRVIMPSKFRNDLGDKFYITRGFDPCVTIYPTHEWEKLSAVVSGMSVVKVTPVQRYLFGYASDVEPDKQGRILIPPSLKKFANLDKEIVIIGLSNRAEIWDAAAWDEKEQTLDPDEIAAQLDAMSL